MPVLHGKTYWDWIRLRDGSRVRRSFGTSDASVAREVKRMLDTLHGRREWDVIEAAVNGPSDIGDLFDHWRRGEQALAEYRLKLNDVDLNSSVEGWVRWARRGASESTVAKYTRQLRALIPENVRFPRSAFTRRNISAKLSELEGSGSTLRRYHAAWSSFANYLVEQELIEVNPLRSVKAPRANGPKELWLDLPDILRLVKAQPEPYRTLAAIREATGMEIGAALAIRRRDIDLDARTIYAHGTKNAWRSRPCLLDDWAVVFVKAYFRAHKLMPDALLFDKVHKRTALDVQQRAAKAIGLNAHYTLHDCRHSYAVRKMKEGVNVQVIASNLGHKDATLVLRNYGKFKPTVGDFEQARRRGVR